MKDWPAMKDKKWQPEQMMKDYANIEWKISHKDKGKPRMKMSDYITYCKLQVITIT